jgi:hypothetical protein
MKLEASDEEEEIINEDEMMTVEESGLVSVDTSVDTEVCVEAVKKPHKRKTGWGPTLRIPRPRRVSNDGNNMMQRAQELKKENLGVGRRSRLGP